MLGIYCNVLFSNQTKLLDFINSLVYKKWLTFNIQKEKCFSKVTINFNQRCSSGRAEHFYTTLDM